MLILKAVHQPLVVSCYRPCVCICMYMLSLTDVAGLGHTGVDTSTTDRCRTTAHKTMETL